MVQLNNIDYISSYDSGKYKYITTKEISFILDLAEDYWEYYSLDNKLLASFNGVVLKIYPGFTWDGSTFIGNIYENNATLQASLVHDVLYNVGKCDHFEPKYCLIEVDRIYSELIRWYDKRYTKLSYLYYFVLITFGIPWKFGYNQGFYIKTPK